MLPRSAPSPETAFAEARNDLIAWVWGGAVWSAVTIVLYAGPPDAAIGAACAFCLRRLLRQFVAF